MMQELDKQFGPLDVKVNIENGKLSLMPNYAIAGFGVGITVSVDVKVLIDSVKSKISPTGSFAPEEIAALTLLETALYAI